MLPAATSLKKQGANKGAITAFLISTPESGVDSIAITYALLDPLMTVIRPVAAFITAMCAGFIENTIHWPKTSLNQHVYASCPVDNCCDGIDCPPDQHAQHHKLGEKIVAGWKFALNDVWGDIALWFFAGLLFAGCITALIPEEILSTWLGGGISSMLFMLVIGIPLYICATASTPIAAALILKGVSPGAALVFLLVGPATNVTSLSVLIGILGKKSTLRYLLVLAVSAVLFGLGVDKLYQFAGVSPQAVIGEAAELIPYNLKLASSIFLLIISVKPVVTWVKNKFTSRKAAVQYISDFPSLETNKMKSKGKDNSKGCSC